MLDDVPGWVLHETHSVRTYIDALYDGDVIAEDIPLDAGTVEWTGDSPVPGRLDLSFPSEWAPRDWRAPLAAYGQRLAVRQVLTLGSLPPMAVNLGQFLIQGWDHEAFSVSVEAVSLEQVLLDYEMPGPYTRSGTTYSSNMRNLCQGLIGVDVSAMSNDPTLAAGVYSEWAYGTPHLTAVLAIADKWNADLAVDADGILVVSPKATVQTTPHVTWTHGEADAYVSTGGSGLRDDIHNGVIVYADTADHGALSAFRQDDNPASPTYWGPEDTPGPFGRRTRTVSYNLPLDGLSKAAAQARVTSMAQTELRKELKRTALVTVTAPPDPRVQLGDTARVTLDDGRVFTGLVDEVSLPLTALEGAATYSISVGEAV